MKGLSLSTKAFKNKYSLLSVSFVVLTIISLIVVFPSTNVLSWDVFGYYLYLPSFFIYNDLGIDDLTWVNQIVETYNNTSTLYQFTLSPTGHNVIQYSMGMAILFLPFFLLGHGASLVMGFPVDGFSEPYQVAFIVGNIFYMVIGLIYLRKVLLLFYSDKITSIVLLILFLGTNYFFMIVWNIGMSHNYLFSLYALLLWTTIKWHNNKNNRNALTLGVVLGIIILVRPSEIVSVLIPLLYGFKSISERVNLIITSYKNILFMVVVIISIGLLQLVYWKLFSGNFVYDSYKNKGEGFDFLTPHILDVLFSFRKGWLVYTPIMGFSILGIFFLYKYDRNLFFPVVFFFLFNLYIVSSWSNWWYAASFGQRALVQSYAILALPLGSFVTILLKTSKYIKGVGIGIICVLVSLNLFQTRQIYYGTIDGVRMTKAYYFSTFGQLSPVTKNQKKLLMVERSSDRHEKFINNGEYIMTFKDKIDFENNQGVLFETAHSGSKVCKLDRDNIFSNTINKKFEDITKKDHAWIKISLWVYPTENWEESKLSLIATFQYKEENYKYSGIGLEELDNIIPNQWNKVEMDYLTPEVRTNEDVFYTYAWLQGNEGLFIDDLSIEVYNKKDN